MDYTEFLIRIAVALLLSFSVGLERQWRKRSVGLRTNVLVCLGAFLFVSMSVMLETPDDLKIAAQVVSGIGFLGAGVIIKDGANIRGLNTAATLWCNAAIGVLCATGLLLEAATGTFLILCANIILRHITKKIEELNDKKQTQKYILKISVPLSSEEISKKKILEKVTESDVKIKEIEKTHNKQTADFSIHICAEEITDLEHIITELTMENDIERISYEKVSETI